jgi:hypothetical protein
MAVFEGLHLPSLGGAANPSTRAGADIVEVEGSHVVIISQPQGETHHGTRRRR